MINFIKKLFNKFSIVLFAILLSAILFLCLPVSYYFYHSELYHQLKIKKNKRVKIDTIKIKQKKKKIHKIKKIKRKSEKWDKNINMNFKLDLNVLSSSENAAVIDANNDFQNVIDESEADVPPLKKLYIPPEYPRRAKTEGIEGVVIAKLLINEYGNVIRVKIIKAPSFGGFEKSVREAAKKWKFEPAKLNNMPIKVWATQVIEFML